MTEEDGITYELSNKNNNTLLHIRQGDFSVLPNGEEYLKVTEKVWDRILPKVKELAEKIK